MEKYICTVCDYVYDPELGDPENGIEPGTSFEDVPGFRSTLQGLFLVAVHVFHVNGVLHRLALRDRRLGEVLAAAKLLQDARALVFTFELFQGALDVFALFYRHDNHNILCFLLF